MTNKITMEKTTENLEIAQSKTRRSGVELLRLLAILLICISHAVQTSEQFLDYSSLSVGIMFLKILRYSGQIGNILFVICSSWFLFNSKGVKIEKALKLLLDSMLISIVVFLGFVISGQNFTFKEIIHQIFPDLFSNMWFVPVYVIFYLIHPLLNGAINAMNKKQHFSFCLILFCLFGVLGLIGWNGIVMNSFVGFCCIYFIVCFIKKYCKSFYENKKLNLVLFFVFSSIFIFAIIIKNVFSLSRLTLDQFYSPILLPTLLCLFNLFNGAKIQSKMINYLASCSLFVYCIHENILLRTYVRPLYYKKVLNMYPNAYFGWVMLCAIGMFVGAYLLSILYKHTLSKITKKSSQTLSNFLTLIRDKIYLLFFNKEK